MARIKERASTCARRTPATSCGPPSRSRAGHGSQRPRGASWLEPPALRCPASQGLGPVRPLVCGARALQVVGNPSAKWSVGDTLRSCLLCDPRLVTYPLWAAETCIMGDRLHLEPLVLSSSGFLFVRP